MKNNINHDIDYDIKFILWLKIHHSRERATATISAAQCTQDFCCFSTWNGIWTSSSSVDGGKDPSSGCTAPTDTATDPHFRTEARSTWAGQATTTRKSFDISTDCPTTWAPAWQHPERHSKPSMIAHQINLYWYHFQNQKTLSHA